MSIIYKSKINLRPPFQPFESRVTDCVHEVSNVLTMFRQFVHRFGSNGPSALGHPQQEGIPTLYHDQVLPYNMRWNVVCFGCWIKWGMKKSGSQKRGTGKYFQWINFKAFLVLVVVTKQNEFIVVPNIRRRILLIFAMRHEFKL